MKANVVQAVKSALANPVVVVIETTWKTPSRIAASPVARPSVQISATSATEASREDAEVEPELLIVPALRQRRRTSAR